MKKIITLTLILVLATMMALAVSAAKVEESGYIGEDDEISWKLYDNGELIITGDIAIPDYTSSKKAPWNEFVNDITKITIKADIKAIGKYAFYMLDNVEEVTIPSTVKTIGERAFYKCTSLEEIVIPAKVTAIAKEAFSGCKYLEDIEIKNGVKSIGESAFANCSALFEITLPESIQSIGKKAFAGCTDLEEVYMRSDDAPALATEAFDEDNEDLTIYYPKNAEGYDEEEWEYLYTQKYTPDDDDDDDDDEDYVLGDVNDDGKVKSTDLVKLYQYLVGEIEEEDINIDAADVDEDGKITVADSVYLARHLADWDDYEL